MIFKIKNRDKLLGVAAVITFVIGSANALEYFFAGINYLHKKTGTVEKVTYELYEGRRGRLYEKTTILLYDSRKKFSLSDNADKGGHIEVTRGDTITLYVKKWFHFLYNYDYSGNIYYVERAGRRVYNNIVQWKAAAFTFMCIFGGCALLLGVMYLDQVKNISISNWFRKRFLNKQENKQE